MYSWFYLKEILTFCSWFFTVDTRSLIGTRTASVISNLCRWNCQRLTLGFAFIGHFRQCFVMWVSRVLCKKNDKNIFSLWYSRFFINNTVFLCTNNVHRHYSRCLRPFLYVKQTIFLRFLNILFLERKSQ